MDCPGGIILQRGIQRGLSGEKYHYNYTSANRGRLEVEGRALDSGKRISLWTDSDERYRYEVEPEERPCLLRWVPLTGLGLQGVSRRLLCLPSPFSAEYIALE